MIDLISEALKIQEFCVKRGCPFCFIGGLAVQHWGEPRLTRDIDLTICTESRDEGSLIDTLLESYSPRMPGAKEFALVNRVLLLSSEGMGIDIALGGLPFEKDLVSRAVEVEFFEGKCLRLCSAEDLIVLKTFAARPQDWLDVKGIIIRQQLRRIDWSYVDRNLSVLCELKEEPELLDQLKSLRESLL